MHDVQCRLSIIIPSLCTLASLVGMGRGRGQRLLVLLVDRAAMMEVGRFDGCKWYLGNYLVLCMEELGVYTPL